jgi:uncharacterized protein YecT (DUF1311 family)
MRYLCLLACMFHPVACFAADDKQDAGVTEAFTQCMSAVDLGAFKITQWTACHQAEFKRQDAALNAEYQNLRARLPSAQRAGLQNAQRAWLAYRDAWCQFEGTLDVAPSPDLNGLACRVDATAAQVRKLKTAF